MIGLDVGFGKVIEVILTDLLSREGIFAGLFVYAYLQEKKDRRNDKIIERENYKNMHDKVQELVEQINSLEGKTESSVSNLSVIREHLVEIKGMLWGRKSE